MRHGERADFAKNDDPKNASKSSSYNSQTNHDPNLTDKGLAQASEAGLHFKNSIENFQREHNITFDEVRVEASPFLRTLQTGAQIAEQIGSNKVHVNYRTCELLFQDAFSNVTGGVIETLELKTLGS